MKKHIQQLLLFTLFSVFTLFTYAATTPLPLEQAFPFSTTVLDPNTVEVSWDIQPGYFLYKDRFKIALQTTENAALGQLIMPKGEKKTDKIFGTYGIYRDQLKLGISLLGQAEGSANIIVTYQGCADWGYCYPPTHKKLAVSIDNALHVSSVDVTAHHVRIPIQSQQAKIKSLFANYSLPIILLACLGLGFLLSFTPCVLPMIPILSSIIIGKGNSITTKHAFCLSFVYVTSMAVTYALIGMTIAYLGSNVQAMLQSPWVLSSFSLVFVLLALSMFGFYELKLPDKLSQKINRLSAHQKRGNYIGVAIMGFLSTLIVSPCVTAPLIGVLSYIAKSGDIILGGLALFFLGFGMGIPLLLIGTSAGKLLPKAGEWMLAIQKFFGVLLLGVAIFLLDRILPGQITMLLWAGLLVISAIHMGALRKNPLNAWHYFWQGLGLMMLIYSGALVIGASMGNTDPLRPLAQSRHAVKFKLIKSVNHVNRELAKARSLGSRTIVDFYADWCLACKTMEHTVFTDPRIINALKNHVRLRADVTANDKIDKTLLQHFGVIAPPTIIFFGADGQEIKSLRVVGEINVNELLKRITWSSTG